MSTHDNRPSYHPLPEDDTMPHGCGVLLPTLGAEGHRAFSWIAWHRPYSSSASAHFPCVATNSARASISATAGTATVMRRSSHLPAQVCS